MPAHYITVCIAAVLAIAPLSGCLSDERKSILVAPTLDAFGREYPDNFAAAGRQLAVEQCSSCHAIDHESASPNRDAPPMNTLVSRYNPDSLADDLIEGVRVGHGDMPLFDFNVIAADSLIAYLETIDKDRRQR
jgi:mono/diheme cytochrome c family protein